MRTMIGKNLRRISLLTMVLSLLPLSAYAHVNFSNTTATPGSHATLTLEVADGCSEGDTTKIEMVMPDKVGHLMPLGIKLAKKSAKGWSMKIEKVSGKNVLTASGPAVKVSDAKPLTISFMASLPASKGAKLAFPTTQYCGKEINSWVEPRPADGKEPVEGTYPVPTITLSAKSSKSMPKGM